MDEKKFLDAVVGEFEANYERVSVEIIHNEYEFNCYNFIIKYYQNAYCASRGEDEQYVDVLMQYGRPIKFEFSDFACVEDNWAWKTLMKRFVLGE